MGIMLYYGKDKGGHKVAVPIIVCEYCQNQIVGEDGVMIFSNFYGLQKPLFAHAECNPRYPTSLWHDMSVMLYDMLYNTKIDLDKAKERSDEADAERRG